MRAATSASGMCSARTSSTTSPRMGDVDGVSFAVWAPNAQAVRVKGDFNGWDGRQHSMRSLGSSGVWELFLPGVLAGACYKFEIRTRDGYWVEKADPLAFGTEVPPLTASRVVEPSYAFKDAEWMEARAGAGSAQLADECLRSAPRLLAGRPQLPGTGQGTGGLRQVARLHPRGVHARGGAPLRRVLGLPGHVLLRPDVTLRPPRRIPVPRGRTPPGRHRRAAGLGAGALPQG